MQEKESIVIAKRRKGKCISIMRGNKRLAELWCADAYHDVWISSKIAISSELATITDENSVLDKCYHFTNNRDALHYFNVIKRSLQKEYVIDHSSKGIIYIMSTVVPGLIKIGKTQSSQYENRMQTLESNGYRNITGLKREFAIEVEDYSEKEALMHNIFCTSRIKNTELFSLDLDLAIQLFSSLEGRQIYPKPYTKSKEQVFEEASEKFEEGLSPGKNM